MSNNRLTLLLPGYTAQSPHDSPEPAQSFVGHRLLDFTGDARSQPWQAQLADTLNVNSGKGKLLACARLDMMVMEEALLPGIASMQKGVVCADPIHLKADRDSARLIPARQLALTDAETDELIDALNQFVVSDGFRFFKRDASHWYMSGQSADVLESYPPSYLANRNASMFMPDGDESSHWRRLMTEIQMLLHTHPINQKREAAGLMPVNSVWFWGGAALPDTQPHASDVVVYSDEPDSVALARHRGVECFGLSQFDPAVTLSPAASHHVVVDLALANAWLDADVQRLEQALARINTQWLEVMVEQVRSGTLSELSLLTEDGLQGVCNTQTVQASGINRGTGMLKRLATFFGR